MTLITAEGAPSWGAPATSAPLPPTAPRGREGRVAHYRSEIEAITQKMPPGFVYQTASDRFEHCAGYCADGSMIVEPLVADGSYGFRIPDGSEEQYLSPRDIYRRWKNGAPTQHSKSRGDGFIYAGQVLVDAATNEQLILKSSEVNRDGRDRFTIDRVDNEGSRTEETISVGRMWGELGKADGNFRRATFEEVEHMPGANIEWGKPRRHVPDPRRLVAGARGILSKAGESITSHLPGKGKGPETPEPAVRLSELDDTVGRLRPGSVYEPVEGLYGNNGRWVCEGFTEDGSMIVSLFHEEEDEWITNEQKIIPPAQAHGLLRSVSGGQRIEDINLEFTANELIPQQVIVEDRASQPVRVIRKVGETMIQYDVVEADGSLSLRERPIAEFDEGLAGTDISAPFMRPADFSEVADALPSNIDLSDKSTSVDASNGRSHRTRKVARVALTPVRLGGRAAMKAGSLSMGAARSGVEKAKNLLPGNREQGPITPESILGQINKLAKREAKALRTTGFKGSKTSEGGIAKQREILESQMSRVLEDGLHDPNVMREVLNYLKNDLLEVSDKEIEARYSGYPDDDAKRMAMAIDLRAAVNYRHALILSSNIDERVTNKWSGRFEKWYQDASKKKRLGAAAGVGVVTVGTGLLLPGGAVIAGGALVANRLTGLARAYHIRRAMNLNKSGEASMDAVEGIRKRLSSFYRSGRSERSTTSDAAKLNDNGAKLQEELDKLRQDRQHASRKAALTAAVFAGAGTAGGWALRNLVGPHIGGGGGDRGGVDQSSRSTTTTTSADTTASTRASTPTSHEVMRRPTTTVPHTRPPDVPLPVDGERNTSTAADRTTTTIRPTTSTTEPTTTTSGGSADRGTMAPPSSEPGLTDETTPTTRSTTTTTRPTTTTSVDQGPGTGTTTTSIIPDGSIAPGAPPADTAPAPPEATPRVPLPEDPTPGTPEAAAKALAQVRETGLAGMVGYEVQSGDNMTWIIKAELLKGHPELTWEALDEGAGLETINKMLAKYAEAKGLTMEDLNTIYPGDKPFAGLDTKTLFEPFVKEFDAAYTVPTPEAAVEAINVANPQDIVLNIPATGDAPVRVISTLQYEMDQWEVPPADRLSAFGKIMSNEDVQDHLNRGHMYDRYLLHFNPNEVLQSLPTSWESIPHPVNFMGMENPLDILDTNSQAGLNRWVSKELENYYILNGMPDRVITAEQKNAIVDYLKQLARERQNPILTHEKLKELLAPFEPVKTPAVAAGAQTVPATS